MEQSPVMMGQSPEGYTFTVENNPFASTGFPFDDEMMPRGRQDIRSHLDDLAQRHPEFADQLRCPPWGGEMGSPRGTWGRKRRGSGSCGDDDVRSQASGTSSTASDPAPQSTETDHCEQEQNEEPGPLRGRTRNSHLPQYGLRNTVDLGQQQHDSEQEKQGRAQRSWSAPPDNRTQPGAEQPQRFVSRIDINPLNPCVSGSDSQGKPPVVPKPQQQSPQQQQHTAPKPPLQGSNIRHIPIFVEGRDEPVIPRDVNAAPEQIFSPRAPQQQPSFGYTRPSQFTSHHQFQPQQTPSAPPPAAKVSSGKAKGFQQKQPQWQQQQPPEPNVEHKQEVPQQQTKPPEAPPANDPISRVQTVQRDVDELKFKVESFSGNSRNKDYAYLDEMLTRNLLKLDDIETEGKENVRQARKEVIRNIQRCISILEAKVPSPEEQNKNADDIIKNECLQMETVGEEVPQEKGSSEVTMEVDNTLVGSDASKVEIAASQLSDTQDNEAENLASLIVESLKDISEGTSNATNQETPVEMSQNSSTTTVAASTEETPPMVVEQDHTAEVKDSTAQVNGSESQSCKDSVQECSVENNQVSESGIINSPSEGSDTHPETSHSKPKDSSPTEVKHAS